MDGDDLHLGIGVAELRDGDGLLDCVPDGAIGLLALPRLKQRQVRGPLHHAELHHGRAAQRGIGIGEREQVERRADRLAQVRVGIDGGGFRGDERRAGVDANRAVFLQRERHHRAVGCCLQIDAAFDPIREQRLHQRGIGGVAQLRDQRGLRIVRGQHGLGDERACGGRRLRAGAHRCN